MYNSTLIGVQLSIEQVIVGEIQMLETDSKQSW